MRQAQTGFNCLLKDKADVRNSGEAETSTGARPGEYLRSNGNRVVIEDQDTSYSQEKEEINASSQLTRV